MADEASHDAEQIEVLKSMGFSHVPDSTIVAVLQQNCGSFDAALDTLLAMQFDTSESATLVPNQSPDIAATPQTMHSETGSESSKHGGDLTHTSDDALVDSLVGLLLDTSSENSLDSKYPGSHARPCPKPEHADDTSLLCDDLERALLGPAVPLHQPTHLPLPPPSSGTSRTEGKSLQATAAEFQPGMLFPAPSLSFAPSSLSYPGFSLSYPGFQGEGWEPMHPRGESELFTPSLVRLVVLVGLPGSGKSTLSQQFRRHRWWIVSQDELGSRQACERVVFNKLSQGFRVLVDRTNMDRTQREHWTRIARDANLPVDAVAAVHLDVPVATCKERVLSRPHHKTLPPERSSLGVIDSFLSSFQPPTPDEGFCTVIRVTATEVSDSLHALITSRGSDAM